MHALQPADASADFPCPPEPVLIAEPLAAELARLVRFAPEPEAGRLRAIVVEIRSAPEQRAAA